MAVVAAVLFLMVVGLGVALALAGIYFVRVVRPQLVARTAGPKSKREEPVDPIAGIVEQLNALARLRDQGILTSKEFSSKKGELLERM
jgi:hypothetical protein